ncbi:MAG: 2OG-Fe(II) oxygenase, partial [Rhodopila sp.]|nr:2OG-Fe(II) oxygenase [Rhodopila sp.]
MHDTDMDAVASTLLASLEHCECGTYPFRHWLPARMLPDESCAAIDALCFPPPSIGDTLGKRETNNSMRLFF